MEKIAITNPDITASSSKVEAPKAIGGLQDESLVAAAQAGDTRAFDILVEKYSPRLYGMLYNMLGGHADAEDLLQEAFTKAYRSLHKFRGHSAFYTWLYAIASNSALNFIKKRNRRKNYSIDDEESSVTFSEDFLLATAQEDPSKDLHVKELGARITRALKDLTPEHRAVVVMFDIEGMRHTQISKILGVSEGTVRSRLYYAHQQLRNYLSDFRE